MEYNVSIQTLHYIIQKLKNNFYFIILIDYSYYITLS